MSRDRPTKTVLDSAGWRYITITSRNQKTVLVSMTLKPYLNQVHFPPKPEDEKEIPKAPVKPILGTKGLPLLSVLTFQHLFIPSELFLIFASQYPNSISTTISKLDIHHNIHHKYQISSPGAEEEEVH